MTFRAVDERVYEYACQEGNYAMGGLLRGARLLESESEHRVKVCAHGAAREDRLAGGRGRRGRPVGRGKLHRFPAEESREP